MARIYDNATALIGNTPLVRINSLSEGAGATVLAKLEFYNPANSVKDRIGVAIIDAAVAAGALPPEIGRAHVWNSSHVAISYAVFCLKKKKRSYQVRQILLHAMTK